MRYSTWQGKPCVLSDGPYPVVGLLSEPTPQEQLKLAVYLAAITGAAGAVGSPRSGDILHLYALSIAELAVKDFYPEPPRCPATAQTPTPSRS